MGQPRMIDADLYRQAGIDPNKILRTAPSSTKTSPLKENIKRGIRIADEQEAINRYVWENLPEGMTSQELERLLYYHGQLCFFYDEATDNFVFMTYAMDAGPDIYGRYVSVQPVPIALGEINDKSSEKEKAAAVRQASYYSSRSLKVLHDIAAPWDVMDDPATFAREHCVLLRDYTPQRGQQIIPRQQLQDGVIDVEADCIPFMRTALLNSTGVQGVQVRDKNGAKEIEQASASVDNAALAGRKYIAMAGQFDFQILTDGTAAKSEEFLLAQQSLMNFRRSLLGLTNGGLFQKKAHELQTEADMNAGSVDLILQDGLTQRQTFADIVNSYTGLGMNCRVAESASGMDKNMDGEISEDPNEGPNAVPAQEGGAADE